MNKNRNSRNRFMHLYNPREEGLGSYDVNYINAFENDKKSKKELTEKEDERLAA